MAVSGAVLLLGVHIRACLDMFLVVCEHTGGGPGRGTVLASGAKRPARLLNVL